MNISISLWNTRAQEHSMLCAGGRFKTRGGGFFAPCVNNIFYFLAQDAADGKRHIGAKSHWALSWKTTFYWGC